MTPHKRNAVAAVAASADLGPQWAAPDAAVSSTVKDEPASERFGLRPWARLPVEWKKA
ncbi:MAG: hypothetical protein Q8N13_00340 [Acidovorax sp.]|nr:hypothetical protein [Acidovorax sp.]